MVIKSENDVECGYIPPSQPIYRWVNLPIETDYICDETPAKLFATYSDSRTYSAECDSETTLWTATTKPEGYEYSAMTSAEVGSCVTKIWSDTFRDCVSLTSVTIPDSVTSIAENHLGVCNAFANCSGLTSITLPNNLVEIGHAAFYNCASLTSITIPDSVTYMGQSAFSKCSGLTSATIGSGLTNINTCAFQYCYNLESVTIPNSVTSIGDYAFYDCDSLESVTIPNSVTSICYEAFYSCDSLTTVTMSDSATYIGDYVFSNSPVKELIVADGSKTITYAMLESLYNIEKVTIPSSVTSISSYAFEYCDDLTTVYIKDLKAWCEIDFQGSYANPMRYADNLYLNGAAITGDLVIPEGITKINDYAFYGCKNLKTINFPSTLNYVGRKAFFKCIKWKFKIN